MKHVARWLPGLALIIFGGVGFIVGGVLAFVVAGRAGEDAARAERLAPLTAAELESAAPGQEALLEGQIDQRSRAIFRDFVAYVREEYRGKDAEDREQWFEDERATPPLLLATGGSLATVGDAGYELEGAAAIWRESDALSWSSATGEGTKRYRGLRAGDTITAIGAVAEGAEGRELAADTVFAGTRAEYIAERRSSAAIAPWIGAAFGLVGLVVTWFGVRVLRA